MTPAEKLDEIVRALNHAVDVGLRLQDECTCGPHDYCGCGHEAWNAYGAAAQEALTLARELRDNAGATRMACPSCKRVDTNVYGGTICPKCWAAHVVPALLILSDPTP